MSRIFNAAKMYFEPIFVLFGSRQKEIDELVDSLESCLEAMNYMGDVINTIDAVEDEDIEATQGAFIKARALIAKHRGGSNERD